MQHERGAGGADEQAGVLEQHARGGLGAGGRVHVAHDREQRLDLRALARLAGVRPVGERERERRHGQDDQAEEHHRREIERAHRTQPGREKLNAERGRREGESAAASQGGGTATRRRRALTDRSGRFRWGY